MMGAPNREPLLLQDGATLVSASVEPPHPPAEVARAPSTWLSRNVKKLKKKLPAVTSQTWKVIWDATLEFLKDPVNVAVLVWMVLSGPACLLTVLLELGYLNRAIPDAEQRERLDEISVQFCNALFVLACLAGWPLLIRHVFLLWRWSPKDKLELRRSYCKGGNRKPHDWSHMAIVVFWGQVTCITTFAFSAVYWLWPYGTHRPATFLAVTFLLSMVAPVLSCLHLLLSPLSADYSVVRATDEAMLRMFRRSHTFFQSHREVAEAEWNGSVVPGCCQDEKVALLTCLFPCCLFGYNMERLGFGHRVVHTLVFLIVLFGPVTVFTISASSLRDMGFFGILVHNCGVFLTLLGPAYAGAWRIRMRETYKLPGSMCCSSRRLADVCIWLWCPYCALCQEIRTADQYEIHQHSFYSMSGAGSGTMVPLEEGDEEADSQEQHGCVDEESPLVAEGHQFHPPLPASFVR